MLTTLQIKILFALNSETYTTADEVVKGIGYSNRTIRSNLQSMKSSLGDYGCQIISKPRFGYKLEITNEQVYQDFHDKHIRSSKTVEGFNNREDRIRFIVNSLFSSNEFIKIDDISEQMFVSRSTFTNDMKEISKIFDAYNLKIIHKSNYGVKVMGNEKDFRSVLELYDDSVGNIVDDATIEAINNISKILVKYNNRHQISLSETYYRSILHAVYIQVKRIRLGCYVEEGQNENIPDQINIIAHSIIAELEALFQINYTENELKYFSLHLMSKGFYSHNNSIGISQEMEKLVDEMLGEVRKEFGLDFLNDFDLRMQLIYHLLPMDVRIRYGFNCDNPLISQIKEKYAYSFAIAAQSSVPLVKYYSKYISQEEIGLLAIFFELALERIGKDTRKSNILVVCGSGKGSSQLLKFKFKNEFGEYLNNIFVCDIFQLESFDLSNINYVFSTVPITKKIELPIHEVSLFFDYADISKIKKVLEGNDFDRVSKYFKPEHFIGKLKAETKEDVIRALSDLLHNHHNIDNTLFSSIMKREQIASTEYGNGVAMPHAMESFSDTTIVYVAILEKPILWSEKKVQVIILTLIGRKKDDNIQDFYNTVINILYSPKKLYQLVKGREFSILKTIISEG